MTTMPVWQIPPLTLTGVAVEKLTHQKMTEKTWR
jgi:hypothetical protein